MLAALPHPTSPYKGEETASGESVKPVHEESGLIQYHAGHKRSRPGPEREVGEINHDHLTKPERHADRCPS